MKSYARKRLEVGPLFKGFPNQKDKTNRHEFSLDRSMFFLYKMTVRRGFGKVLQNGGEKLRMIQKHRKNPKMKSLRRKLIRQNNSQMKKCIMQRLVLPSVPVSSPHLLRVPIPRSVVFVFLLLFRSTARGTLLCHVVSVFGLQQRKRVVHRVHHLEDEDEEGTGEKYIINRRG